MDEAQAAFHDLGPDQILDAVETTGMRCDGRINALNSFENRVYQVGIEDSPPVIAKFYRPHRWSDDCILEEHAFTAELAEHEIPVVAPLPDSQGKTLFCADSFRLAVYRKIGGRPPEPDDPEHLMQLGRCVARLHNVGAVRPFRERPLLDIESYAVAPGAFLLEQGFIPPDLVPVYDSLRAPILDGLRRCFERAGAVQTIRLHGDCHLGNVLMGGDGPMLVDFDDARSGPAVQDLWMFLSGERAEMTSGLHDVLAGYCDFREFDPRELHLVEALRTLRLIHYAGWIAARWHDPAFPRAFPWFNTQRYWEDHILSLREQLALLDEPPLQWQPDN